MGSRVHRLEWFGTLLDDWDLDGHGGLKREVSVGSNSRVRKRQK